MRVESIIVGGLLTAVAAAALGGCASGPYDRAGYTTVEKDNRIYVFIPNSTDHQMFKKNGEMAKSVTRVGAGPEGKTLVAAEQRHLDKYIAAQ